MIDLVLATGLGLTELAQWHPRDLATLVDRLEERAADARRQQRS